MQQRGTIYHRILANYFPSQPLFFDGDLQKKPHIRKCVEQPFQQIKAQLWDEVTDTLCNLDFIQAKAVAKMTYDLVKNYNDVLEVIPDNSENIKQEKVRQVRMEKYTNDLIACAKGEIKIDELEIPESITLWSQEKIDEEIERMKTNPTRLDRLIDFKNSLGQEVFNLQEYAHEFPNLVEQQMWNYADQGPVGESASKAYQKNQYNLIMRSASTRPTWNLFPQVIQILKGHTNLIQGVDITFDGKRAISCSKDKTCKVWDLKTGQSIITLNGHSEDVKAVAITPDGKWAISGSSDKTCILWNANTGQMIISLERYFLEPIERIAITPNGKIAISSSKNTCIIFDLNAMSEINSLRKHTDPIKYLKYTPLGDRDDIYSWGKPCIVYEVNSKHWKKIPKGFDYSILDVDITPDRRRAIVSFGNCCIVWDDNPRKALRILERDNPPVNAVAITPDGKKAVTGLNDGTCTIWDLNTGQVINTVNGHSNYVGAIAITPDCKRAITSSDNNTCIIWDLNAGQILRTLIGHNSSVTSVAITPDGKMAISGSIDNTCILWDLNSIQANKTITRRYNNDNGVFYNNDKKRVVICSCENNYLLFDLNTGQEIKILQSRSSFAKIFNNTPDGKLFIPGSDKSTCIILDLNTGEEVNLLNGHTAKIYAVAITPDGKKAITVSEDHTGIIWNLKTGQLLNRLEGHTLSIEFVSITPDNKRIITGSEDDTCMIWNIFDGKQIHTLSNWYFWGQTLNITPEGKKLITSGFGDFCLWDLDIGEMIEPSGGKNVTASAITPDGLIAIIFNSWDQSCIFLNLDSLKEIKKWKMETREINFIQINPNGKSAIFCSYDGTCIIYDLQSMEKLNIFFVTSEINNIVHFPGGIFVSEKSGKISFLKMNAKKIHPHRDIVTIRHIWDFELQQFLPSSADCPLCGHRFSPPASVVGTIKNITRRAGLKLDQSPCLELPDEAWEDPGLLGNCPKCGEELKFNPFIAGGDNL
jgi:WD40 repeat protein